MTTRPIPHFASRVIFLHVNAQDVGELVPNCSRVQSGGENVSVLAW